MKYNVREGDYRTMGAVVHNDGVVFTFEGRKAPVAAGKIHSDIQRGFIKAEIVSYDDLIKEGSMNAAREKGLIRSEGKEYIMQEGDIVLFKFNV